MTFVAGSRETEMLNQVALVADETSIDTLVQRHDNFSYDPCLAGECELKRAK